MERCVKERAKWKKKNWIVNRRQRHNRMIGANNNTCTHASHTSFTAIAAVFPPFFVFTIHFIEFYRMRVCGSDLHFTIETIDIGIRVSCETHPWSSLQFQEWKKKRFRRCLTRNSISPMCISNRWIHIDLLHVFIWFATYNTFFPQFVRSMCTFYIDLSLTNLTLSNGANRFPIKWWWFFVANQNLSWKCSMGIYYLCIFCLHIQIKSQKELQKGHNAPLCVTLMQQSQREETSFAKCEENQILNNSNHHIREKKMQSSQKYTRI